MSKNLENLTTEEKEELRIELKNLAKENAKINNIEDNALIAGCTIGGIALPIATAFAVSYIGKVLNIPNDVSVVAAAILAVPAFYEGFGQGGDIASKIVRKIYYKNPHSFKCLTGAK